MFKLFSINHISALVALLSLITMNFSLMAEECCECCDSSKSRIYIGGFGGGIYANSTRLTQTGTIFFAENEGGPLAVDARGHSHRRNSSGFGGAQIGYELSQCQNIGCSNWSLSPAAELEAYFFRHTKKGSLINPTDRLLEHDFVDSFPMDVEVYLVNGVISLSSCCFGNFSPYIGGGVGATNICIRKAKSL